MNFKRIYLFLCFSFTSLFVIGQNSSREDYIDKYKSIAISEMERAGVPASIKLAQGILESNGGKSTLAKKANNHFGMKCGPVWKGNKYYLKDDDYDENGELIKSCFRVFKSAKECYIAHSEFLRDPRKKYRYGFLFNLDVKDYNAWAHGLKKAGYATSPTYAEKLISVIELYNLSRFDSGIDLGDPGSPPHSSDHIASGGRFIKINNVKTLIADGQETILDISLNKGVSTKRLIKYNDKITSEVQSPIKDSRVFLQNKRNGYRGKQKYHIVKEGETLYDISQKYAVKLKKLQRRNRIEEGREPKAKQRIKLRGFRVKKSNAPRTRLKGDLDEHEREMVDPSNINEFEEPIEDFEPLDDEEITEKEVKEDDYKPLFHVVEKGETLYGIARRYNVSVDDIKNLNKFSTNIISVDQRIRIR